ncbi:MAG: gamma-glutamyl-gamma-aminobutyrate hydrolase family protein [Anaerolineales bacterium]
MRPLIGITGRKDSSARLHHAPMHAVGTTYTHAIRHVGGAPVILPPTLAAADWVTLLARLDGLLLTGGEDVAPSYYGQGEEPGLGGVDQVRDQSELGLVKAWLEARQNRPLLAICRGHQVLNVALGGALYQDIATHIPAALDHAYSPGRPMEQLVHSVKIAPESRLAQILGATTLQVNSAHHQAVKTPGEGLAVVARAPDGVIEATELPTHPFALSVQWHPEAMVKLSASMWPLFEAFVQAVK